MRLARGNHSCPSPAPLGLSACYVPICLSKLGAARAQCRMPALRNRPLLILGVYVFLACIHLLGSMTAATAALVNGAGEPHRVASDPTPLVSFSEQATCEYPGAEALLGMDFESQSVKGAPPPEFARLSIPEKLDRAAANPAFRGVVHGVTGAPRTTTAPSSHARFPDIYTDHPFLVRSFEGRWASPYQVGSTIALRTEGGTCGEIAQEFSDSTQVPADRELFVFIRDQGTRGGGNTSTTLVVTDDSDFFEIRGDRVYGQGEWASFSEPIELFRSRFRVTR